MRIPSLLLRKCFKMIADRQGTNPRLTVRIHNRIWHGAQFSNLFVRREYRKERNRVIEVNLGKAFLTSRIDTD